MKNFKTVLAMGGCAVILGACGGSSSSSPTPPPTSPAPTPTPTPTTVTLGGKITFDSVPHNTVTNGLNYAATTQEPVRGATVEMLDSANAILASTVSDANGDYSFTVNSDTQVRIRVKAEMVQTTGARWDVKVTDNTNSHALYSLQGDLVSSGSANSTRNLNAASGWGGSGYTATRAAAPFAILSPIYDSVQKFVAVDSDIVFTPVEFRWSTANRSESGTLTTGQIGTSSYRREAGATLGNVYILGDANSDTDEYDTHVVVHEWGHYFEDQLSRSDSIGGSHSGGDRLDPRVAFGEGFGNALSGIITDDPFYRDSLGTQQNNGFSINVESNSTNNRGWFNESSVQSILYDLYDGDADGPDVIELGLGPIYEALTAESYTTTPVFTSIFSFINQLKSQTGIVAADVDALLSVQSISGTGAKGDGETNSGNVSNALPVYKTVATNGTALEICSLNDVGQYNKMGVRNYVTFNVPTTATHTLTMTRKSGATSRDPDFYLYRNGGLVLRSESGDVDTETSSLSLVSGDYVIDAYDFNNADLQTSANNGDACYDFTITQ